MYIFFVLFCFLYIGSYVYVYFSISTYFEPPVVFYLMYNCCMTFILVFLFYTISVFHPKCVDVWLQKWNRTCPLCKSTIKRRGKPLFSGDPESSRLLTDSGGATPSSQPTDGDNELDGGARGGQAHHAAAAVGGGSSYGAVEHSSPLRLVTAGHRRSTSGVSSSSSQGGHHRSSRLSRSGLKREPTTSVTTIELNITSSGETSRSASNSPSPLTSPRQFHTPRQSDNDDDEDEGGNDDNNKELTPSFRTANGENESVSSSVRV